MENFRIATPIFTAIVPEAPYGTSIKDFLEDSPIPPGSYPALVEGYSVILKFTKTGSYWIHAWASAPRERSGPYFSELLYQIEVNNRERNLIEVFYHKAPELLEVLSKGLTLQKSREYLVLRVMSAYSIEHFWKRKKLVN